MMTHTTDHPVAPACTPKELAQTLGRLVRRPSTFFSLLPEDIRLSAPLIFLVALSLASAGARMPFVTGDRAFLFGVFLVNTLGMATLTALVLYGIAMPMRGTRSGFTRFFAVTAYSSGVALLISWIPDVAVYGELWKWFLVGSGLVWSLGLSRLQALFCIGLSIGLMTAGFWGITAFLGALAG